MSASTPDVLVVTMGIFWFTVLVAAIVWSVAFVRRWRTSVRAADLVSAIALAISTSYGWLLGILFVRMFGIASTQDRWVIFHAFQPVLEVVGVIAAVSAVVFIALQLHEMWQLVAHRLSARRN